MLIRRVMTIEEFINELTTFLDGKVAQDTLPIGQDYNFDWEHNNSNIYIQLSINESAFRESKSENPNGAKWNK